MEGQIKFRRDAQFPQNKGKDGMKAGMKDGWTKFWGLFIK